MRFRKTAVAFLTVLLIIVGVTCGAVYAQLHPQTEETQEKIPMVFLSEAADITREIVPWYDNQGKYCVFLPSYADLSKTQIEITENGTVLLGQWQLESGMTCSQIRLGETYPLVYTNRHKTVETEITFLRSENLPAVYVDTRSGDMTYIHSLKGSEEPGEMQIILPDGQLQFSGSLRSFGGRGNATWDRDKKPYKLDLSQEADILGMGSANKWILLSNSFDPSHIRNQTVYDTAQQIGLAFTPESTWVDLYLNGEYAGLYLLCEKNEIHSHRVDIDEDQGVLISIEKEDRLWEYGGDQFVTDHGIPIRVRHGSKDMARLKEKLATLENAILASDGVDPVTGKHWTELIDLDSWAKKYLIEEVFGNLDAGSISQFFYWEGDGKIFAGPVWDYDISMGNPNNWQLELPQMLFSGRPNLWTPGDTPWFYALYQKPAFQEKVVELYEKQLRPVLQEILNHTMDQYEMELRNSAKLDQIRWSTDNCLKTVEAMKTYMSERMVFLDSLWLKKEEYHLVSVYIKEHVMACYAVRDGEFLAERPVPAGTDTIIYEAWYDGDTDQPFDFSSPITNHKLIYLKETNLLSGNDEEDVFSLRKAVTYAPVAVLVILMLAMLAVDRKALKGNEGGVNDKPKISP